MTEILVALIALAGVIITNHSANKRMADKVNRLERKQDKQYMGILRLTIMSEEMPISERIAAGKEYIDHDGNGDVKKFYQKMLKDHTK